MQKDCFLSVASRSVLARQAAANGPGRPAENVAIRPRHLRPSFNECDTGEFASTHMTNEGRKDRQIRDLFLWKNTFFGKMQKFQALAGVSSTPVPR